MIASDSASPLPFMPLRILIGGPDAHPAAQAGAAAGPMHAAACKLQAACRLHCTAPAINSHCCLPSFICHRRPLLQAQPLRLVQRGPEGAGWGGGLYVCLEDSASGTLVAYFQSVYTAANAGKTGYSNTVILPRCLAACLGGTCGQGTVFVLCLCSSCAACLAVKLPLGVYRSGSAAVCQRLASTSQLPSLCNLSQRGV